MRKKHVCVAINQITGCQEDILHGTYGYDDIAGISYVISPRDDKELLARVIEAYNQRDVLDYNLLLAVKELRCLPTNYHCHAILYQPFAHLHKTSSPSESSA